MLAKAHPLAAEIGRPLSQTYYWSVRQTEFATDLLFADAHSLAALYPQFLHHGVRSFASPDVLRFLGQACPNKFRGEVTSTLKRRPEGVRLRHPANGNSIKVYDKQDSVLRVETTIVNPNQFRVYRPSEGERRLKGQKLRYGVADLYRRAEVRQAAHGRYWEALASVTGKTPLAPGSGFGMSSDHGGRSTLPSTQSLVGGRRCSVGSRASGRVHDPRVAQP